MSHWPFIIAAYVLTLVGGAAMAIWAYVTMRRAEQAADNLRKDR